MTVHAAVFRPVFLLCFCLVLAGCMPGSQSSMDDEKDPFFIKGKSRLNALDYEGAIDSFEKALEANPKSAAAHLELGILYEQRMNDHAAAIYHFERHLKLRPNSNVAESVRQRIVSCKLELAKTVPFALVSRSTQEQLNKLLADNAALRQQAEELKLALAQAQIAATNAYAQATRFSNPAPVSESPRPAVQNTQGARTAPSPQERETASRPPANVGASGSASRNRMTAAPVQAEPSRTAVAVPRSHVVRKGETPYSIAKRYGVATSRLMAANPGVDARRLREGQTLRIPPPKD